MELPSDFWPAVASVIALVTLLATGATWLVSTRREKERDRLAKEAHDLSKIVFESDTIPRVSVELYNAAEFPGYGVLREGDNYALYSPSPWTKPTALLVAAIKNEGRIAVTINDAGIRLEHTDTTMALPNSHADPTRKELFFPYILPPRESVEIRIQPVLIRRMLGVLNPEIGEKFSFWVSEPIGTRYLSTPQATSNFLEDGEPFTVGTHFQSPIEVTQIGEEEFFPEGIYPADLAELPPGQLRVLQDD